MTAKLILYDGSDDEQARVFSLAEERILIGTSADNELVIEADEVALAHISLELRNTQWVLQDLGSEQGTTVNDRGVTGPYYLEDKDRIQLGSITLEFNQTSAKKLRSAEEMLADEELIRGRDWFAHVAGLTLAFIIVVLFILGLIDYFELLPIWDLFGP